MWTQVAVSVEHTKQILYLSSKRLMKWAQTPGRGCVHEALLPQIIQPLACLVWWHKERDATRKHLWLLFCSECPTHPISNVFPPDGQEQYLQSQPPAIHSRIQLLYPGPVWGERKCHCVFIGSNLGYTALVPELAGVVHVNLHISWQWHGPNLSVCFLKFNKRHNLSQLVANKEAQQLQSALAHTLCLLGIVFGEFQCCRIAPVRVFLAHALMWPVTPNCKESSAVATRQLVIF